MTRLRVAAATHVGRKRSSNEDSYLVDEQLGVFAVADGMGGHAAGEIASSVALDSIQSSISSGSSIDSAINLANATVREHAASNPQLHGMGTTLTLLSIVGIPTIGHVGDSRAYRLRDGELAPLTEDHSLVAELVRAGKLTPEQAATHPRRSIITRALGADETITIDLVPVHIQEGDRLLLCSDGLSTMVDEAVIASFLSEPVDVPEIAQSLIRLANEAGGDDNITVIVAEVLEVDSDLGWMTPDPTVAIAATDFSTAHDLPFGQTAAEFETEYTGEYEEHVEDPYEAEVAAEVLDDFLPPEPIEDDSPAPARRVFGGFLRLLWFALPILVIAAFAVGAVNWWADRSWFVAVTDDEVTLNHGISGGMLWHEPARVESPTLLLSDLLPQDAIQLRDPKAFGDRNEAEDFIAELRRGSVTPRVPPSSEVSSDVDSLIPPETSSSSEPLLGP